MKPTNPVTLAEVLATVEAYVESNHRADEFSKTTNYGMVLLVKDVVRLRRRLHTLLRRAGLR